RCDASSLPESRAAPARHQQERTRAHSMQALAAREAARRRVSSRPSAAQAIRRRKLIASDRRGNRKAGASVARITDASFRYSSARVRIFDTFPFDVELDLLEHRLAETYDLVDVFVLVEAAQTYSGRPKELTFALHRERFAWASAKLRHITLNHLGTPERSARERAAIQRDAVRLGLRDADPDDVILLFDVDEIASPSLLRRLREHGVDEPRRVLMTRHYEHADAAAPRSPCCPVPSLPFQSATPHIAPGRWDSLDETWHSASGVAVPFRALLSRSAFDLRFSETDAPPLADGGRH